MYKRVRVVSFKKLLDSAFVSPGTDAWSVEHYAFMAFWILEWLVGFARRTEFQNGAQKSESKPPFLSQILFFLPSVSPFISLPTSLSVFLSRICSGPLPSPLFLFPLLPSPLTCLPSSRFEGDLNYSHRRTNVSTVVILVGNIFTMWTGAIRS